MRASLPMYNPPTLHDANRRFWDLISARLREAGTNAPETLCTDGLGPEFWIAEDMVFSQTCGLPYRTMLLGKVQIVGTPDYGVEGCAAGYYNSVLVKRKSDPRAVLEEFGGARVALNGFDSQSGFAALATEVADSNLRFGSCIVTGAHAASILAVANGEADIAAIDAVTWRLTSRTGTETEGVEVFGSTCPTPGLPYITANGICRDTVFDAVSGAIEALSPSDRELLMLRGLVRLPDAAYLTVPTPAGNATALIAIPETANGHA